MFKSFVSRMEKEELPIRSLIVKRNGDIIFKLFNEEEVPNNIFSHSKAYTSTAIGILVDEGKLKTSDRVIDILPEIEKFAHKGAEEIRLNDLLTMSSGFDTPLLMMPRDPNKIGNFLKFTYDRDLVKKPGSKFCYSNGDTYTASLMAARVAKMKLIDFAYETIFKPLNISYPYWEEDPEGNTFGASGLELTITDMMKLGELYLNNGVYDGKQVVSKEWVKLATSKHINTLSDNPWGKGYGYQFWMNKDNVGYRADGAFGQLSIVIPEKNTVIGVQCKRNDITDKVFNAIGDEIVDQL